MAVVRTNDGAFVSGGVASGKEVVPFTPEQAEADVRERNRKAEEFGINTRYVVADE